MVFSLFFTPNLARYVLQITIFGALNKKLSTQVKKPLYWRSGTVYFDRMPDINVVRELVMTHTSFSFSRSGGKGGQNVNKVNTKVLALFPIEVLVAVFSEATVTRVRTRLSNRINRDGMLFVQVDEERTQGRNREIAYKKLSSLLAGALKKLPVRKKTVPGKRAKEARLQKKRHRSEKKIQRRFSPDET